MNFRSNLQKSLDKPYTMASSSLDFSRVIQNSLWNTPARRVTLESVTKTPGSLPNVDFYSKKLTNAAPDSDTNDEARPQLEMLVEHCSKRGFELKSRNLCPKRPPDRLDSANVASSTSI
jgi:hypothetical protein